MVEESAEAETALAVIPVNEKRSKYVDFTIICKDQATGKMIKYGVEKSVIAASSTFFHDLFEACPNSDQPEKEELELLDNFHIGVVLIALQILSGAIDTHTEACILK